MFRRARSIGSSANVLSSVFGTDRVDAELADALVGAHHIYALDGL